MTYAGTPPGSQPPAAPFDLGYVPGELLVRFAPKADGIQLTTAERNQILSSLGAATVIKNYRLVPGLTHVKLPAGVTVEQAIAQLNKTQGIIYAQPNHYLMLCSGQRFPNDLKFGENKLWGMHNIGQYGGTPDADIDGPEAWYIETDASEIIVAVIDSGVDYWHEDLVDNMWINPGEDQPPLGILTEADWNGDDDDGNELVDDICGYDFCTIDDKPRDPYPMDDDPKGGHGTHIAGTIGARGNNGVGVVGVCWRVKIMALRLFLNTTDFGKETDAIDCINYAVGKGAKVISCSWGRYWWEDPYDPGPNGLKETIKAAGQNGVLFVAAVNNQDRNIEQYPFYPACWDLDNIISVMATDWDDNRADWRELEVPGLLESNYGAVSVDLAAPGKWILSCYHEYIPEEDGKYGWGQGTSMSTPHVAGACALVWSVNPSLSPLEVKGIILSTVDELEALDGLCVTEGRLNLNNAVLEAIEFPTDDELVGWWKLNEGEGTIAYDSAGDNNGDLIGPPQWVDGKIYGALDFDGDNDYVSLSPIVALLTDTVTISAWIKRDDIGSDSGFQPIVSTYYTFWPYTHHYGYFLFVWNDLPCFYIASGTRGYYVPASEIDNGWHHLAGTYDGTYLRIHVDGQCTTFEDDASGLTGFYNNTYIGYEDYIYDVGGPVYFDGKIDDVRVYNYALDMFEIWDFMFPGTSKFSVKNIADDPVAWFDNLGNLFLKGTKQTTWQDPSGEADEFIIEKNSGPTVYIDDSGNLFLQGDFTQGSTPEATGADEFRIQNSEGDDVAIIKASNGDVHIKGKLYENPD